jgi:hypothetical protein
VHVFVGSPVGRNRADGLALKRQVAGDTHPPADGVR